MLHSVKRIICSMLLVLCGIACGQPASREADLRGARQQKIVRAGTVENISVRVIPSGDLGDAVLVSYDVPAVQLTLIAPGGRTLSAANAGAFGYEWANMSFADMEGEFLDLVRLEGMRTRIGLPMSAPRGWYTVRVDARRVKKDTTVVVDVSVYSGLVVRLEADRVRYAVHDQVLLTGSVRDDSDTPQHPAVSLKLMRTAPIAAGVSVESVSLVRTEQMSNGNYRHFFTAGIVSTEAAEGAVRARVESGNKMERLVRNTLRYEAVKPGVVAMNEELIPVDTRSKVPPHPGDWHWTFEAVDAPVLVAMKEESANGSGVFTGVFRPERPGTYRVVMTVSGAKSNGEEYTDGAETEFFVGSAAEVPRK